MANIKISEKGKALLRSGYSSKVVRAIINRADELNSHDGITININGKAVKVKAAPIVSK